MLCHGVEPLAQFPGADRYGGRWGLSRPATARLLGFNPVSYDGEVWTATGKDSTAWVRLPELDVAGFKLRDVPASVRYGKLDYPLIGLAVLKQLGRFEVARGHCSLMW